MTYRQTPIKAEGHPVKQYRQASDKERLHQAEQYIKDQRKQIENLQEDAMRYRRMRQLEVVIMAEDGAKYMKGKELDEYIDNLPMKNRMISRAELLKELTPGLNAAFTKEYEKCQTEHAELIAAHIHDEVMLNVKA